jgi:hypothetical protein
MSGGARGGRFRGVCVSIAFSISGVRTAERAWVFVAPGAIPFTRIPLGPRSKAMFRVR